MTAIHDNLYAQAEKNLEDNTFDLNSWQEVKEMVETKGGFARTKWGGKLEGELKMKELAGVSSRCMPLKQSGTEGHAAAGNACQFLHLQDVYKRQRQFLRSREFWWQEGHTIHETAEEAKKETEQQLNCYADFCRDALAMPCLLYTSALVFQNHLPVAVTDFRIHFGRVVNATVGKGGESRRHLHGTQAVGQAAHGEGSDAHILRHQTQPQLFRGVGVGIRHAQRFQRLDGDCLLYTSCSRGLRRAGAGTGVQVSP